MASPEGIVFSICHEVGNLLAAMRLYGELLDEDSGRKISELSARSGSLISLVRAILSDPPDERPTTGPQALLEGLRVALDDPNDPRLLLEAGNSLPSVAMEGEVLNHLLLSDLFAAFEQLEPDGQLRLRAEQAGNTVVFVVEGGPAEPAQPSTANLSGRHLTLAIAESLLERRGGEARSASVGGVHRVELCVPVA